MVLNSWRPILQHRCGIVDVVEAEVFSNRLHQVDVFSLGFLRLLCPWSASFDSLVMNCLFLTDDKRKYRTHRRTVRLIIPQLSHIASYCVYLYSPDDPIPLVNFLKLSPTCYFKHMRPESMFLNCIPTQSQRLSTPILLDTAGLAYVFVGPFLLNV